MSADIPSFPALANMPAYRDVITLIGTRGELDLFARNAQGLHVPVTTLDPRDAAEETA